MQIFVICMAVAAMIVIISAAPYSESSTRKYGKRLGKKLDVIETAIKHQGNLAVEVISKATAFTVNVENVKVEPGIKFATIPVYTCRNVYVNNELVCKLHKLEALFGKTFVAEYSEKRHEFEVSEIIDLAYKKAKLINKDYWKAWSSQHHATSSFYVKESE